MVTRSESKNASFLLFNTFIIRVGEIPGIIFLESKYRVFTAVFTRGKYFRPEGYWVLFPSQSIYRSTRGIYSKFLHNPVHHTFSFSFFPSLFFFSVSLSFFLSLSPLVWLPTLSSYFLPSPLV